MFARVVRMGLRPDSSKDFALAIDHETIPTLKKYTGFSGELVLVSKDGKEAIGISLWDRREHAETYNEKGAPAVFKALQEYTKGKPELTVYEVTNSTIETIPVRKAA